MDLARLLMPVRRKIELEPDATYKLVTLPLYGKGARLRKVVTGADAGTARYQVREGDLMVSKIDARKGSNSLLPADLDGAVVTGDSLSFAVDQSLASREFMDILVRSPWFAELCDSVSSGTTNRVRLDPKRFMALEIRLPSLAEQWRIVDLIGALDDTIEAGEAQESHAEDLWWRIARRLEAYAAGKPTVPLGEIADISGGITKNKKDFERADLIEVPYLRVANVHRRFLDLSNVVTIKTTEAKLDKLRLRVGDLVLNEGGDKDKLGRGAVWQGEIPDCIHQNHVFRARISNEDFFPEFVSAWTNSFGQQWFETFGTQTTGIASISKSALSKFPIPVLGLSDQRTWADALDEIGAFQEQAKASIASLRAFRTELLTSLLSGVHEIPELYDEVLSSS